MVRDLLTRRAVLGGLGCLAAGPALANAGHAARPTGVDLDPLLRLTTQAGTRLDRRAIRGRPFVVLFGYTHCPEVCPTALQELSDTLAALGPDGDRLAVLFVTVDPKRDTAAVMQAYLGAFDPRIIGLTGGIDDVKAAAEAFGAPFARTQGFGDDYAMRHSSMLYLMDRYGLLAVAVAYAEPADRLADLSRRLLRQ